MATTAADRVRHIKHSIDIIRGMLAGRTFQIASSDPIIWAAFERHLEIISEASRHIPDDWKQGSGSGIAWSDVASLGNVLRHTYQRTDARVFWNIYTDDLDPLEAAIDAMIAAHPDSPPGGTSR